MIMHKEAFRGREGNSHHFCSSKCTDSSDIGGQDSIEKSGWQQLLAAVVKNVDTSFVMVIISSLLSHSHHIEPFARMCFYLTYRTNIENFSNIKQKSQYGSSINPLVHTLSVAYMAWAKGLLTQI